MLKVTSVIVRWNG